MSARDSILAAVRRNLPQPTVSLPDIPRFASNGGALLPRFRKELEQMGGRSFDVATPPAAKEKVTALFPSARVICSAVREMPGNRWVGDVRDPHALSDVDVGIIRSPLGVAEAGAIWVTQTDLIVTSLGVLSQHLVVLLDPAAIVETMHDAYDRIDIARSPYGVFLAGPSATGDIEGVIVHGAQGARTLTVLLLGGGTAPV
jgi:L-lactate dehydrogenase complex protein LldG